MDSAATLSIRSASLRRCSWLHPGCAAAHSLANACARRGTRLLGPSPSSCSSCCPCCRGDCRGDDEVEEVAAADGTVRASAWAARTSTSAAAVGGAARQLHGSLLAASWHANWLVAVATDGHSVGVTEKASACDRMTASLESVPGTRPGRFCSSSSSSHCGQVRGLQGETVWEAHSKADGCRCQVGTLPPPLYALLASSS